MNNDSTLKGILVAGAVAFVCALVVSLTTVTLRPYQDANLQAERQTRIQAIVANIPGLGRLAQAGTARALVVALGTDRLDASADPALVDVAAQLQDESRSVALTPQQDLAHLKRRENVQVIYAIEKADGALAAVILPIRGLGYASMIEGYLAMAGDGLTVQGIAFYAHGETPGLGSRIDDPAWQAQWVGRLAYNNAGDVILAVVPGPARTSFQVDAISGATRTSNGVGNMVQFWLGPLGYGPYLNALRRAKL